DVPAQDAVDGAVRLGKAPLQEFRQRFELVVADVAIDVGEDVLDEDLAAELLAEEADVSADHRSEVEQDRRLTPRETGEEFPERLGGEQGLDHGAGRRRVELSSACCDAV